MPTPQGIRQGWDAFFSDPFLSTESVKDRGVLGKIGGESLRSLYWKIYLEYFPSLETDAWTLILQKERQSYDDLKASFLTNPAKERSRDDLEVNNPLSLEEDSPWTQYFKDTELQKVIRQDVERTMPDQSFFREPSIQELMTNILFIWSKVNPDVSYRQGMHELLAPVVFVVNEDKFDPSTDPTLPSEQAIVFDSRFVEHDAFVLFSRIMRSAKPWFVVGQESSGKSKVVKAAVFDDPRGRIEQKTIPIIAHCRKIQNELIRVLDPELHLHLQGLGIEPQLYALRWLRLLFGREFEFADLFQLWDGLFADDPNLGLVDWICAALLIFLRKDLINSDYSMALHRLMKFPSKDQLNTTPAEFIASAKGLRERYAQKALQAAAPLSPVEQSAPTTVRRGNAVPWISHASNQRTNPLSPPAVTNSPAADIDARATSPGSTDDTSTNNAKVALLESRIATLWREAQKAKERDRALAKKVQSCVALLRDLHNSKGAPQSASELEGVIDELKVVVGELTGEVSTGTKSRNLADTEKVGGLAVPTSSSSQTHMETRGTSPLPTATEPRPPRTNVDQQMRTAVSILNQPAALPTSNSSQLWATSIAAVAHDVDASAKAAANSARRLFQDLFDENLTWRSQMSSPSTAKPPSNETGKVRLTAPVEANLSPTSRLEGGSRAALEIERGYKQAALRNDVQRTFPPTPLSTTVAPNSSSIQPRRESLNPKSPTTDPLAGVSLD